MQRPTGRKKILVYSHDTFGLGNIRRMLAITQHLLDSISDLSVLMISGSPMIHSFRLPETRFDYVKLPCLGRTLAGGYSVKRLGTRFDELVSVRSQIIRATVNHFKPDVMLVDKKPRGIADELLPALDLVHADRRAPDVVLLLRDILDDPETTSRIWRKNRYFQSIERYYRSVLVMGSADVFDVCKEYRFPEKAASKVVHCGYMHRPTPLEQARPAVLSSAGKRAQVLVTAGGGEDGFELLKHYIDRSHAPRGNAFCNALRYVTRSVETIKHVQKSADFSDKLLMSRIGLWPQLRALDAKRKRYLVQQFIGADSLSAAWFIRVVQDRLETLAGRPPASG